MKIYIANHEPGRMGGGWTFQDNLAKSLSDLLSNYEDADIYFIAGASMVTRDEVQKAKDDGKKIVLRCDNVPRPSRNRGTSMTRMKDFAEMADLVIYQSKFSKELLNNFLNPKRNVIILNGCDLDMFSTGNKTAGTYLYARSSSDETKNWEMARARFQEVLFNKSLTIIGKALDPKVHEYNFDLFQGEQVRYMGEVTDRVSLADIYRNNEYLLYSFFNDACSNTLIEALCSGMIIIDCYGMLKTGGAPEIMDMFYQFGRPHFSLWRMGKQYQDAMEQL